MQTNIPETIRELLDACRDDFDLARPEMQPLRTWLNASPEHRAVLESFRQDDARLHRALHAVDVPKGLKEKVLLVAGVATSTASALLDECSELARPMNGHSSFAAEQKGELAKPKRTVNRRSVWLVAGASLATISAAVLLVFNWGNSRPVTPSTVSARDLCEASLHWIEQAETTPWPAGPKESDIYVPKGLARKEINTEQGPTACLLTKLDSGARVYKFIFRANGPTGLPNAPPKHPNVPRHGYACSAYQQQDLVYVVAVEGTTDDYRHAIE